METTTKVLKRADPTTIRDKFLVGYQGWYTCPGDGEPVGPGHHGWLHWFNQPIPSGGRPNTDLWPDVSSYSPSELFPAPGLKSKSGDQAFLFSSRHPKTVQRHFHWMAEHGIDGAFLQRFASECDLEAGNQGIRRIRDEVGDRVLEAAEKEGRVFAIMYDVSNVPADRIQRILERDWTHLIHTKAILDSPNYLREHGKPVVVLYGFGFAGTNHTPSLLRSIAHFFRFNTPTSGTGTGTGAAGGVYLIAGTPSHWRTSDGDAEPDRGFMEVWLRDFDAVMPWSVGRWRDEKGGVIERERESRMMGDVKELERWNQALEKEREGGGRGKVVYVPVVYPGGSGFNLSGGKWAYNDIKRKGGRFLWAQIVLAKRLGARFIYAAMWDEYDEGTALMPVVPSKRLLPVSDNNKFPFMALDEDGYDLPSDWYMRICGFAAEALRSERRIHETFPSKELQDYWSTRPRYEVIDPKEAKRNFVSGAGAFGSGSGSSGVMNAGEGEEGGGQTYQEWLVAQREDKEEPPPPPYSLEVEEANAPAVSQTQTAGAGAALDVPVHGSTPAPAPVSTSVAVPLAPITSHGHIHPAPAATPAPAPNQASRPPPVNTSSRPQNQHQQSYSVNTPAMYPPGSHSYAPGQGVPHSQVQGQGQQAQGYGYEQGQYQPGQPDSVDTLANDFENQTISPQAHTQTPNQGPGRIFASPPPLHPAHPASSGTGTGTYSHRPHTSQSYVRPSNSNLRPPSQSGSAFPQSHSSPTTPSFAQSAKPESPIQWPPPEWGVGSGPTQNAGANLTRPNTMTASSYTASSSLRPHATIGASAGSPTHHSQPSNPDFGRPFPAPSPGPGHGSGSVSPYPGQGPSPSLYGQGGPSFPAGPNSMTSGYSGQNTSLYPGQGTSPHPGQNVSQYPGQGASPYPGHSASPYPGQNTSSYASTYPAQASYAHAPMHTSPSHTPSSGSTFPVPGESSYQAYSSIPSQGPPFPDQSYNTIQGPSYPGHMPQATYSNPGESSGFQFPQAQGTEYFNVQQQQHAHHSYSPNYIGQSSPTASYQPAPHDQTSFPAHNTGAPGGWYSGNPMPTRPPTHTSFSQPTSGMSFPTASTGGGGAFGFALSAVDRVAGKKKRDQLESGVGSLAQSGSKLFGKFTK